MPRNRKECCSCGEWKHVSQFYANPNTSDGLDSRCKDCLKEYAARNRPEWRRRKEEENAKIVEDVLINYNKGLQANRLAKRLPKRTRVIPRIVTECRNPRAFSHNGEMVIKSYHEVERCPYCGHQNYLVRTGYEHLQTNR